MLIPRQSQSSPRNRMDVFQPNLTQLKRNVARKSTSNRPLKNRTNTLLSNIDKTDPILTYNHSAKTLKSNSFNNVKYYAPISEKPNLSDVNKSPQYNIEQNVPTFKTTSPADSENCIYHEESEAEDDEIDGIFSISHGLVPFLSESNLSPHFIDSSDESLDTLNILNYPVNADFSGAIFKDVPYFSNKLAHGNDSDTLDTDKSESVKCNLNVTLDNDNDKNIVHKKGIELIPNTLPSSVDGKTNEDSLVTRENRLVGVSVREDYVICEDRPMKMTVIQAKDFDIKKYDNVSDDVNFHDDNANDETDFPKVVCAVSLGPGCGIEFEDILSQYVTEENQNSDTKKKKPKKRKATSNLFFGSRSKKRTRRFSKSNQSVNTNTKFDKDSSQDCVSSLNNEPFKTALNIEENGNTIKAELETVEESNHVINSSEFTPQPDDSFLPDQSVQNNCDNLTISDSGKFAVIKSEIFIAEENEPVDSKSAIESDSSQERHTEKSKEVDSKKKNGGNSADKKSKKEINEGVLLHVEAAKETEIMRDGKILKDKQDLLKDIESKIEKNLPVEVKEFDIQQSLTEEILLEQALRLAHQRTSPRRRPLLSKSETKAILSCLTKQSRYKTRKSNDKRSVNDLSSSDEKTKDGLDISADNSDSEVKNPDTIISDESPEKLNSNNQRKRSPRKASKSKKKTNTAAECISAMNNNLNNEKLDMNILAKTFENVLQEFHSVDGTGKIYLKEKKPEPKSTNRKRKSNKKNKNKKKSLVESDNDLHESDTYYESAISQDSFNEDNSSTGNEECKNKRIPVIIIKNKKVTFTDHKSKKRRHTNNLFSIIKTRENNDVCSEPQLEQPKTAELSQSDGSSNDTPLLDDKNNSPGSNKLDIKSTSTVCQDKFDTLQNPSSSEIDLKFESLSSEIIGKDMTESVQNKDESLNDNKLIKNSFQLEKAGLEVNLSSPTSQTLNRSSVDISNKDSVDIVEVVDMDIAEVDSPKPSSNSSQDQIMEEKVSPKEESGKNSLIPFLEGNDIPANIDSKESPPDKSLVTSSITCEEEHSSDNANAKQKDNFGFPIPTISEVNTKKLLNTKASPVKSTSSFGSPSFSSPPPPLPVSMSSPFSSSASGVHTPGFTPSIPQDSIPPLNPAFYPAYSLAPSAPHFMNSAPQDCYLSSSYQQALTPSHLCNGTYLHSTSEGLSYPPPMISSGLSNNVNIPPVYSTPIAQNPSLIIPEIPTTNIQSAHVNINSNNKQFSNYAYPPLNHADSSLSSPFPFHPTSNEASSSVIKKDLSPSPVVNDLQENNAEKSTVVSTASSEVKCFEKPVTSSAPIPDVEKPKHTDIPLSIAARDPRLRNRSLRISLDSRIISLIPSVEKSDNKVNIHSQSNSKIVETAETVQPAEEKCGNDSNQKVEESEDVETKNETVGDNEFPKKKLKKKEIDQELLYKTPLSDLHDAPERTSYSRTLPRKPARRDPRQFPRDTNSEVAVEHYDMPEAQREYNRLVGYGYQDVEPGVHSPHMHLQDSHCTEDYEQNNEHCTPDMRPDYYSRWRQDEFPQEVKRPREYVERRPLLETPSDYRRINYRQRECYGDVHARSHDYSQDLRRPNNTDYRRRGTDVSAYTRWDYAHKRIEGIFPPEMPELEKPYSSKIAEEDQSQPELWEDENEIRDLIDGPIPSVSRPFYRRKRFSKPWKPGHLRDEDSSSSPYGDDLFERRRDLDMRREEGYSERPWERARNRKCEDERANGLEREDRRYHRSGTREGRSRSPRRDYEMYEKKRARSPRRRERNRGPGRGSLSPRSSLDLESPMSPEPEEIPYAEPPKYLPIPQ